MTLRPEDFVNAIRYILRPARSGEGHVDDIDHLGNRRLRTIDELAADELRKGFLKLRRTVQERMSLKDADDMTPAVADQLQEHLARRSSSSSAAASCRRSSTRPTRCPSSRTSGGSRPWARAA